MFENILSKNSILVFHPIVEIFTLFTLCIVSYGSSLHGTFVFDDRVAIKLNSAINREPTNFTAIFSSDFWGSPLSSEDSHKSYRPLTSLMFHLEWTKLKLDPFHMKLINLSLHTVNTVMTFIFFRKLRLTDFSSKISFLAACIFAVHPVHVEAVSGIVSRADLMFCFLYLLCLLLTICPWKDELWCTFIIICVTAIGVLFKESAIMIPLACIFVEIAYERIYQLKWKCLFIEAFLSIRSILLILASIIILTWRLSIANFKSPKFRADDNPIAHADSLQTRVLSQNFLYAYNFKILLHPSSLCFDWSFGCIRLLESFHDKRTLCILLFYVFIAFTIFKHRVNFPIFFGIALCVIPFIPASGIIKVGFVIAERVLYTPSVGFSYLVAYGFVCLWWKLPKLQNVLTFCFILFVGVFILRCRQRAGEWLTEDSLFGSALNVCPNNAKVHYNIARLASDVENTTKAFHHYHQAIDLAPQYDAALMNLGNLYREQGSYNKAEKYLKKAVEITPDFSTAWMNLGIVQASMKQYENSLNSYNNALKYRKNYANCYYNLGNLYLQQNKNNEALMQWQKAVAINPRFQKAWINIITMLDSKMQLEDALRLSQQTLSKHLQNDVAISFLRANILGKLGRYDEAEQLYKMIVKKEPLNYMYYTNMAVLYHRWNRLDDALAAYKKAVDLEPKKATTARENLNKIITSLRQDSEAKKNNV